MRQKIILKLHFRAATNYLATNGQNICISWEEKKQLL